MGESRQLLLQMISTNNLALNDISPSFQKMAGLHSTAGPCCSPRKMAPINMLYLDQVDIIIIVIINNNNDNNNNIIIIKMRWTSVQCDSIEINNVSGLQRDTGQVAQYEGAEVWVQIAQSQVRTENLYSNCWKSTGYTFRAILFMNWLLPSASGWILRASPLRVSVQHTQCPPHTWALHNWIIS